MKPEDISIAKPAFSGVGPAKFIRQSITELKKVSWPSKQDTMKLTIIVIGVSLLVGLYIGGLDFIYTKLMEILIK